VSPPVNGTQVLITIAYTVFVVAAVWVSVFVIRSTRSASDVDRDTLAQRESHWGLLVVTFLVLLTLLTIFSTPYFTDSAEGERAQIVRVESVQFAWVIKPNRVRADQPVEFRLRSKDVNHAFALYRGNRLEVQVQVPPDFEQRLAHTFEQPGTYRVVCLEFCGVNHHLMQSQIEVTP
jgi:cytochrome c oxidase subunit II